MDTCTPARQYRSLSRYTRRSITVTERMYLQGLFHPAILGKGDEYSFFKIISLICCHVYCFAAPCRSHSRTADRTLGVDILMGYAMACLLATQMLLLQLLLCATSPLSLNMRDFLLLLNKRTSSQHVPARLLSVGACAHLYTTRTQKQASTA